MVSDNQTGDADVRIVADAAGFCRLVANRVTPAGLDPLSTIQNTRFELA
jgi:hypothetical protein